MSVKAQFIDDSLENLVANLGTNLDKRTASKFIVRNNISDQELEDMYRANWVAAKLIDIIPGDSTRKWREISSKDLKPEAIQDIIDLEDKLDLKSKFKEAHTWARLYGGCLMVPVIENSGEPWEPIDSKLVKPGSFRSIKIFDRTRVQRAGTVSTDPFEDNFGFPEYYRIVESQFKIHHSRVIRFEGHQLPYNEFRQNNYWSDSMLMVIYESIINFITVVDGAASMVFESNVDVIKVPNLMSQMLDGKAQEALRKRFVLAKLLKSFNNLTLLDSKEDYEKHKNSFAGLHELIDKYMLIICAASDVPATRFLGQAASGFNATGEGDRKNYYDMIESGQSTYYEPKLKIIDKLMLAHLGIKEEKITTSWNSLFQMTDKECAELKSMNATADTINSQWLPDSVIVKQMQQDGIYDNITDKLVKEIESAETEIVNSEAEGDPKPDDEGAEGKIGEPSPDDKDGRGKIPE